MTKRGKKNTINYPAINLFLYACLLVATPFIMLQNYLQGFVRTMSSVSIDLWHWNIPVVPLFFLSFVVVLASYFRKNISRKVLLVLLFVSALLALSQWISDYYINYKIYDLQNNWHYFAYCLFAFIIYSFYKQKKLPLYRINLYVFGLAALVSLFDELFQNLLSQRIFDLSDVAKDLIGVSVGLIIINFLLENRKFNSSIWKIRRNKITDYLKDENSGLALILLFSFCFLWVSSLLTEAKYALYIFIICLFLFAFLFIGMHLWKGKSKKIIQIVLGVIIVAQLVSFSINYKKDFILHNNFMTVYKGIPLMFFDVIFYPDHTFRFVDKKTEFNKTDKELLLQYEPDILLVGSGFDGEGGNGFPDKDKSHFIFNQKTQKGVQVLILDSRSACVKYNKLRENGYRVLFVLHKGL